ncbi:hypothetical protein [Peribacillus sp. SI8-4]|uniref:hypothetical protein n=1 Tax=Peribacillus sp. SI8-4 TaxID=3048009 RepID=UPI0025579AE5|nr:hypothetical protein [Peribacillus sp. SI8-4]
MRKFIYAVAPFLALCIHTLPVQAEKNHHHNSQGQEQVIDNFLLELYQDEIINAAKDYYKDDSVSINFNWIDKKYDVVEMLQSQKGEVYSNAYILKFTILTYSSNGPKEQSCLGTDTITLGIDPILNNKEFNPKKEPVVKFLSFQHNAPPKDG